MDLKKDQVDFEIGDLVYLCEDTSNHIYTIIDVSRWQVLVPHKHFGYIFPVKKEFVVKCHNFIRLLI